MSALESNIALTDRAAAKVEELREGEGNDRLKLRVYITGGGCAGFSYGFTFDETVHEDDTVASFSELFDGVVELGEDGVVTARF